MGSLPTVSFACMWDLAFGLGMDDFDRLESSAGVRVSRSIFSSGHGDGAPPGCN